MGDRWELSPVGPEARDSGGRITDTARERACSLLRRAHLDGKLSLEELIERTDRCAVSRTLMELNSAVRDLGWELHRVQPPAWRAEAASLGMVSLVGGVLAAVAVAVPVAVELPSQFPGWVPFVVATGATGSVGSMLLALSWKHRVRLRTQRGRPDGLGARRDGDSRLPHVERARRGSDRKPDWG